MTATTPGKAPELLYEPSFCNQALDAAGLDVVPPETLSGLARTMPIPGGWNQSWTDGPESAKVARRHPAIQHRVNAKAIREFRELLRLDRFQLATRVGVRYGTVSAWEQGRSQPSLDYIEDLAAVFGVPVEELLDGQPTP